MRQLHDVMLDAVKEERTRLSSRRGLLTGGAKLAAGGAVAVALTASPALGRLRAVAQEFDSDIDVLNYALTLEHLEASYYRDGLDALGAGAFDEDIYANLVDVRDHEIAHVDTLIQVITSLGGTPVGEATYDFGDAYNDPDVFLATAQALENTGVSAYDGAGASIQSPDLLTAAGTIVAVEARHASYLNDINGDIPFPASFETPLTPAEVLDIAGPFIVS